jgi:hypothetical protein
VSVVFGLLGLVAFLVIVLGRIGLPGDEDEEELAGLLAGNWERIKEHSESISA